MYVTFTIKELNSWADIEIRCGKQECIFSASYIYPSSFDELIVALQTIKNNDNVSIHVKFDLETEGLLYFHFSSLPDDLIRFSIYKGVYWSAYEEVFEDQPMPSPIFECIISELAYFYQEVVKEIGKFGKQGFDSWSTDSFNKL